MRPRLIAFATDPAEVVRSVGGWLFDQVLAGWEVTVVTSRGADPRPLRILGARHADLAEMLALPVQHPWVQAVAVRAEHYGSEPRIRALIHDSLGERPGGVLLWGDALPDDIQVSTRPVPYRLSVAARAFKAQALAAALPGAGQTSATEAIRRGSIRRGSPIRVG